MKLSAFIGANRDAIVNEWEAFARALPAGRSMTNLALRDHCREILTAIALDMETSQTREQQSSKSKDVAPAVGTHESAAESHGTLRHLAGFDLVQLVAEFRALRASVLSLWERSAETSVPGAAIQESRDSTRGSTRHWPNPSRATRQTSRTPATCSSECSVTISGARSPSSRCPICCSTSRTCRSRLGPGR
ncbi:RsbRD N-terminal domain-containing protein [Rhizobacter fulvus]